MGWFSRRKISKEDENAIYFYLLTRSCMILLMKRKKINTLQNYLLINFLTGLPAFKHIKDVAHHYTEIMADLQKSTTYMDYLVAKPSGLMLSKKRKKECVINIMLMVILAKADVEHRDDDLRYVVYISEDLGIRSQWSITQLYYKAEKKHRNFIQPNNVGEYGDALEIMQDALSRSHLEMS